MLALLQPTVRSRLSRRGAPVRRAFVAVSKGVFNLIYRVRSRAPRQNEVAFLSRQTNTPSFDFVQLARDFEQRGWKTTMLLKKVTKRNLVSYAAHVMREIGLLARCKVAILDRYDPVVSLIDFSCEPADDVPAGMHDEFPCEPLVIQLWHAFGAYKKFGYQSVGTREGHTAEVTDVFNIHRNYSWIVCSGEGSREAFAEAFNYPVARVVALDRPEYDELVSMRSELHDGAHADGNRDAFTVLMAPTLRKSKASAHPFRDLYENATVFQQELATAGSGASIELTWSFHPLEAGLPAPGNASQELLAADCVVTDYSSIVYEAYLLGKPVAFYVADLDSYLVSPGLNVNPAEICPGICARTEEELAQLVAGFAANPGAYPVEQLEAFAAPAFEHAPDTVRSVVDFALAHVVG